MPTYIVVKILKDWLPILQRGKKSSKPTQQLYVWSNLLSLEKTHNRWQLVWYSCIELVKEMSKRVLTYFRMPKKNKKYIQIEFLPHKTALKIHRYMISQKKWQWFLSILKLLNPSFSYRRYIVVEATKAKTWNPEIICLYKKIKGGNNQKIANFSSSRRMRKWSMSVFFTVVVVASATLLSFIKRILTLNISLE